MTNAEARFSKSLRPRKPEGSLGRTAQDVHLDSHTAPELWRDAAGPAHNFNTLDNLGHKIPHPVKKEKDRREKDIGSWPGTCIQYTRLHFFSPWTQSSVCELFYKTLVARALRHF